MKTRDEQIGDVVRAARGDRSQTEIAEGMVERGHAKWSQSTVWSVEKGTRPLRLVEAESLKDVLHIKFFNLMGPAEDLKAYRLAQQINVMQIRTIRSALAVMDLQLELYDDMHSRGLDVENAWLSEHDSAVALMDPRKTLTDFFEDDAKHVPSLSDNKQAMALYERYRSIFLNRGTS